MPRNRLPIATYRLQFNRDFTFDRAAAIVPYLAELGISHCYASPYLKARAGSSHGYDIVDHTALNPEIGDQESYERLVATLHRHGLGQILDLVPNHMGVNSDDNAWWLDTLENGRASACAHYFDIDWEPVKEVLRGRVLLPVLGGHYGSVLERGELHLRFNAARGEFSFHYYQHRFPLDPSSYPRILEYRLDQLAERLGAEDPFLLELQSLITAFGHLPRRWEGIPAKLQERRRDKEIHKRHLADLCAACPDLLRFIRANVALLNGVPGDPDSFTPLHNLLEMQAYRLAYWRVAADEINYRRFFNINDLAGLRMEQPEVFEATHRFVLELVREGKLDGLRVDHPDGLYDPEGYYRRLRTEVDAALSQQVGVEEPAQGEFYLVVEKILASYERLPEEWVVQGTTGYDFLNVVNGLFVLGGSDAELERIYARFIGHRLDFDEILFQSKRLIIKAELSAELTVLANMLDDIAQRNRHTRDFTLNGFREALTTLVACFPVYRTYVSERGVRDDDRKYVEWAIAQAKKRSPAVDISIYDFIRNLLLEEVEHPDLECRSQAVRFSVKFQQYTAPVMAKALEDTSFYLYNRLVSLNEVGGDPRRFGLSVAAFHRSNQERAKHWPHAMLATSTHDTKRSEDMRARIDILSEIPEEWRTHLYRWSRINRGKKRLVDGEPAPSRNDEYLLYQTLLGAWPLDELDEVGYASFRERVEAYMLKAVREAKNHTSWINPNHAYEEATAHFVTALLAPSDGNPFLADFLPFQRKVARLGLFNGLAQLLLKLTAPGVPDIYQGCELWNFSLVDPDNRRPVDYATRHGLLRSIKTQAAQKEGLATLTRSLAGRVEDGRIKLFIIWKVLELRGAWRELFDSGEYLPLATKGALAEHLCSFARRQGEAMAVVVAPRCVSRLVGEGGGFPFAEGVWADTAVEIPSEAPQLTFANILTGDTHRVRGKGGTLRLPAASLFSHFPVALLFSERGNV